MSGTTTTLDGTTISSTIGTTAHLWTADANGLFTTTADLGTEWKADYAAMLAGHGDQLTALQRLEGNAEAVLENTAAAKFTAAQAAAFRQDAQREFDAIDAAMRINQATLGIDPTQEFNSYTYLKMEETLQQNESLKMLAIEGHGLNNPPSATYNGFTTDFQNKTDGKTDFVGGGLENGENAIVEVFDDIVLSHATFPVVMQGGVLTQLNQNGTAETSLTGGAGGGVVAAANAVTYVQVFVAGDFSTNPAVVGPVVAVPNVKAAPALPTPAAPLAGSTAYDGTVLPEVISGITAHTWTADATGLYGTLTDLGAEWRADYAAMQAGRANQLTPLQRMEGNAEAVLENTAAAKLTATAQAALRMDLQREFDAIDGAMRIDQATYGIDPTVAFTAYSYQKMEETLQGNESLEELGYQGHGVNNAKQTKYDGFTVDFQNRVDGSTYYVGGGPGSGELAISSFLDDDVLTHAPFPVVEHNGVLTQLNQNGNLESALATDALVAANNTAFYRVYVPSDFSTSPSATGQVVMVPAGNLVPSFSIAAGSATLGDNLVGTTPYTFVVTRTGDASLAASIGYSVGGAGAGLFVNPAGSVSFAAGASTAVLTLQATGQALRTDTGFTATLTGPAGTVTGTGSASGTVGGNTFSILDTTTSTSSFAAGTAYSGPVAGLQYQFVTITPDSLNVSATAPNMFIHTGSGSDAINVSATGGTNVLDGGAGSNFLVGGTGVGSQDTFYVDDRNATADTWSTVANFHAGDAASVFGVTPTSGTVSWSDGGGAAGFTGLTLHITSPGAPTPSLTLAGYTVADLSNGRLSASFGNESDGTPYLYVAGLK